MDKYIIVTTFCNKKEIADKMINTLLEKRLVVGSQISEVYSKYWWKNEIEESKEYKLEFRTKKDFFKEIEKEINNINDYEVSEISCFEIKDANVEFLKWIDDNTK